MCIFCDKGEGFHIPYQTDSRRINVDSYPVSPGHLEIVPQQHIESIKDLTIVQRNELYELINRSFHYIETTNRQEVYETIGTTTTNQKSKEYMDLMLQHIGLGKKPDGYNTGNNDGIAAGRTVHHFHFHIIPRYDGDVEDPRGGIRMVIPELCNYKK